MPSPGNGDSNNKLLIGGAVAAAAVLVGGAYLLKRSKETTQEEHAPQATGVSQASPSKAVAAAAPSQKFLTDPHHGDHVKITYSDAEWRFENISNVEYFLKVSLPKGNMFYGEQQVFFDLSKDVDLKSKRSTGHCGVQLDVMANKVHSVFVNSKDVTSDAILYKHMLFLPGSALRKGARNEAVIVYESLYGREGTGLHSMVDSGDGEQYLFTQFESPYCHQFMPCFDQPSLKAVLNMTVVAPTKWVVISNSAVKQSWNTNDDMPMGVHKLLLDAFKDSSAVVHEFLPTARMSTYLYALCAGNYFERSYAKPDAVTPMKLYCRQSYKHLLTEEYANKWFDVSDFSLRFHGEFMGVPYPYGKLDQIFCPEYNWGAMENVGCITYTENYLPKVTQTRGKIISMHNTIFHELAHQWFGNLITMHWWEDLWLNESFATFIATFAQMSYLDEGDDARIEFLNETIWGMVTDQRETTHPIAAPTESVADTEMAERNFDGISYGKGGSWLKQLQKFVSAPVFKEGIQRYMRKHCGGNTKLADFVDAIASAAVDDAKAKGEQPIDLDAWAKSWLTNQGVMSVKANLQTDDNGLITEFKLEQSFGAFAHEVYKQHKMDIIVYDSDFKSVTREVVVQAQQVTDVTSTFKGLPAHAVLLNANCFSFVKVSLEREWVDRLTSNFSKIEDPLDKFYLSFIVMDMIRDGRCNPVVFPKFFVEQVIGEEQAILFQNALGDAINIINNYLKPDFRDEVSAKLQDALLKALGEQPSAAKKTIIISNVLALCASKSCVQKGLKWLQDGNIDGHHQLEQDQARGVLVNVCASDGVPEAMKQELETRYLGDDKSTDAKTFRTQCAVARPDLANKDKYWKWMMNVPEGVSQEEFGHVCRAFLKGMQPADIKRYADEFFSYLPKLYKGKSQFYGIQFIRACYPGKVDPCEHYVAQLAKLIADNKAKGEAGSVFMEDAAVAIQDFHVRYLEAHKLSDMSIWQ